jgi:hypothetical protein
MATRQKWVGALLMLAVLLWISAVPGHTDRGGHGYKGNGHKGHGHKGRGHRGHGHEGSWVFISPRIVVPLSIIARECPVIIGNTVQPITGTTARSKCWPSWTTAEWSPR